MSTESRSRLEELLEDCLSRIESGDGDALDDLCREHPDQAPALRARIESLRSSGLLSSVENPARAVPELLGDFRIVRRLGGGGMGVVYEAEQVSLGRRVALKLVRPEQLFFDGSRARFQREVEAAARLNHPGIVPVHTIGEHQGVPYFAMELVDGSSASEVLAGQQGRRPETLSGRDLFEAARGSWVEACLRITRDVAEALDHAHSRGVVHRDIKPSNIMLTPDGRAMLVDFGLSSLAGSERITRTGSHMGSYAYMPPEEVDGRVQGTERGVRGDVYSLGVTLYELLTLELPFQGSSSHVILQRICQATPVAPRKRNPAVPLDAETVCRTAMDRDPERRYASARAFAADLRNVLEIRPIAARPAGPGLRLQRWAQRRPGWAAAAVLALAVATLVPLFFFFQQKQALARISAQKLQAEANLGDALAALDLLTEVGDERLKMVPEASGARRELLQGALGFYEQLYERRKDDPELHLDAARARRRVGLIHSLLGDVDASSRVFAETIQDLEDILADGDDPAARAVLARTHVELMPALRHQGRMDEAEASRVRGQELYRELIEEGHPHRLAFAQSLSEGCVTSRERGERDLGLEQLAEARPIFEQLVAEQPDDGGATRFQYGLMLNELARNSPVVDRAGIFDSALAVFEELAAEYPDEVYLFDVALTGANAATARLEAARRAGQPLPDDTLARFERSLEVSERLVVDHPMIPKYRENLSRVRLNMGNLHQFIGEREQALEHYAAARTEAERLVAMDAEDPKYRSHLGMVEVNCLSTLFELQRFEEAHAAVERCEEHAAAAFAAMPGDLTAQRVAQTLHFMRRFIATARGDYEGAVEGLEDPPVPASMDDQFRMVHIYLRAAAAAAADETLPVEAREAAGGLFEGRAVDRIQAAVDMGFEDAALLESVESLSPLRDRPDYRALVEELERP